MAQDKAAPAPADKAAPAKATPADVGYFLGMSVGQNLAAQGFEMKDLTAEGFSKGLADGLGGKEPQMTDAMLQACSEAIEAALQTRRQEMMEQMKKEGAANLEKGKLFLEENAKKEGVKQLASGLQYKVIEAGKGASPTAETAVTVHYSGKLIDGTEFDSSYKRGEPAKFMVGQVIPGWRQALQEMKVGDKWMLYIPSNLAYGPQGSPPAIGPNEVLIFEVSLLDIAK